MFNTLSARWAKTALATLAVVGATALAYAPIASADDPRDFKVVNHAGSNITHLYISAATQQSWGDDLLGGSAIEDGGETDVSFSGDFEPDVCEYDLKFTDAEGDSWAFPKLNLCATHVLTFTKQGDRVVGTYH